MPLLLPFKCTYHQSFSSKFKHHPITRQHLQNPLRLRGQFYLSWLFLVFCQSCRSLFRHVRACAAASRLLIVPARRLSSFETGTMPVCAYFRSTIFPIWTFISVPPAAAFFCLLHVLLFHYFTTITYLI